MEGDGRCRTAGRGWWRAAGDLSVGQLGPA